jgi:uncharacterized protein YtpQ (UPF0354 family)
MRRWLLGFFGIFLFHVQGVAETMLTPLQFTAHCVEAFRAATPRIRVRINRALNLEITLPSGLKSGASLENLYAHYLKEPEKKDEAIARFIRVIAAADADVDRPVDRAAIVALLRSTLLLDSLPADQRSPTSERGIAHERLNAEIIIVYAEDRPESLRLLQPRDIASTGLDPGRLKTLAISNLRRLFGKIDYEREEDGLYILSVDGISESGLVLLPEIWTKKTMPVKGDFVIAIPTRSLVLVTGSDERAAVARMRKIAAEEFEAGPYSVSPKIYRYRQGSLAELP